MSEVRFKYPRTFHLPFSEGKSSDDKTLSDTSIFTNREVVITSKMDGECTTLYPDYYHARSIDSANHPSRNWVKQFHASIKHQIPSDWRLCGENLYAKHSIHYTNLQSYFYLFSIWNNHTCLPWDDTTLFAELLDVTTVPVLYRGTYSDKVCFNLIKELDTSNNEGFVVRLASSFLYDDFSKSVAKYVRSNHVQTDDHWMHQELIPNQLST
jgi:hypothetical protein